MSVNATCPGVNLNHSQYKMSLGEMFACPDGLVLTTTTFGGAFGVLAAAFGTDPLAAETSPTSLSCEKDRMSPLPRPL